MRFITLFFIIITRALHESFSQKKDLGCIPTKYGLEGHSFEQANVNDLCIDDEQNPLLNVA